MSPKIKLTEVEELRHKVRSYERHKDDLRAELAGAHAALLIEQARVESAHAESNALRQLVADLCRTRTGKEFSSYEETLVWMRARAIAGGEGV